MFVRRLVSGVLSSWEASETSWRCARAESSSAPSIVLNVVASRESSSVPSASIRRERSRGLRHLLCRPRQPLHRREHGAGDEQAERGRQRRCRPAAIGERASARIRSSDAVDLVERARDLERVARALEGQRAARAGACPDTCASSKNGSSTSPRAASSALGRSPAAHGRVSLRDRPRRRSVTTWVRPAAPPKRSGGRPRTSARRCAIAKTSERGASRARSRSVVVDLAAELVADERVGDRRSAPATATATASATRPSVEAGADSSSARAARSRRRGSSGSAAACRPARSCGGGSRCRRRASSSRSRSRSPRRARR